MPFYEYISVETSDCGHCGHGFTVLQKLSDAQLGVCPECGRAIRRVISPPNVVSGKAHMMQT
ncbi:MAG TPA: zinc ribbon domain-containing protein, partial [Wenzhouxiangella sp.]|nr:zinc ribbon domain-containing protein [Wenzhouxiangella sp.]